MMPAPTLFDVMFVLFGAVTLVAALLTCFARNLVHAAFSLLFAFMGVAGIYVLLQADFLAISQLLIYVGGIMVLLVFGVMLTNRISGLDISAGTGRRLPAALVSLAVLGMLVMLIVTTRWITHADLPWSRSPWSASAVERVTHPLQGSAREVLEHNGSQGTAGEIGMLLLTDYLLPFEVVSVVLLVALIGAAMIARREPVSLPEEEQ